MTTYTASTNTEKIRRSKPSNSESNEKIERNRKNWKTQHYANRLNKRFLQENQIN